MTQFDDREQAYEKEFARNEEFDFKVMARRNKLLGLWAAGQMDLDADAAEAYAKEVVVADFEEAGDEDVYRKVKGDLDAKGIVLSEHQVRREMEDQLSIARDQLTKELKGAN
ncbi:DUF1476 domain-containing protein [Paremcibacter congregatus]|uniref:Aldolase n=1 Tax=Paremcibacter congregatus TaxID=2043170 RepID=A0A2G4YSR6_9PROT|nr:DUF1476 domain-containing protein [Paremcibacter congregatus]PHZ85381.1 hypothetical protein CRD36_08280 [Paremcibacter congregatus]QDE27687.1 DUF1476 domain-containing protein [Paremcibacter congregatus]